MMMNICRGDDFRGFNGHFTRSRGTVASPNLVLWERQHTDDQTIAGCTQVIKSGRESQRNLATAYFNRALAYGHKGDLDHAIADYTQGIQLQSERVQGLHQPRPRI